VAIVLGLLYAVATPPMRAPDERHHVRRLVQIASGGIAGQVPIPGGVHDFARAGKISSRNLRRQPTLPFSRDDWRALAAIELEAERPVAFAGDRSLAYSPLPYLPAVATTVVGLRQGARPLVLLYAARATLLVAGVLCLVWALRLAGDAQWLLCGIALLPTVTFLRSCVSADTLTTAFAFVLFAAILRLRDHDGARDGPAWSDLLLLSAAGVSVALAKVAYVPLTLAAAPAVFGRLRGWRHGRAGAVAVVVLPWVVGAAWLALLGEDFATGDLHRASPDTQLALLVQHPATFVQAFAQTWLSPDGIGSLTRSLVGRFLLLNLRLPWPLVLACLALLGFLVLTLPATIAPRPAERALFLLGALGCVVLMSVGAYLKWTSVGNDSIQGIQGRYLVPCLPFVLYALTPPRRWRRAVSPRVVAAVLLVVAVTSNLWALVAIVRATWAA
jgi:uncharacterized membrane protein